MTPVRRNARRIEEYALVGDCQAAGLVGRDGSIDWLCLPRFDSGACFAALLGRPEHGRWLIAPADDVLSVQRRYRPDTLVLETEFTTAEGAVTVIDFMPIRTDLPDLVRIVVGVRGRVRMRVELIVRFDYGHIVPWVRGVDDGISAVAGPDSLVFRSPVALHGKDLTTVGEFEVAEGQRVPFDLAWYPSERQPGPALDPEAALADTTAWWQEWVSGCAHDGPWRDEVVRSLITLKALTFAPTGAIVAAPTTSLPEQLGGVRNWDYRYCWLRDATFALLALMNAGYTREAKAWRDWLVRAVAGQPDQLQIMYGVAGERRLPEIEVPWLPGFGASAPVRIGNGAHQQFQLDVFGEVLDASHQSWRMGVPPDGDIWRVLGAMIGFVESAWKKPDNGLWEVRGPRRHFTHSKVMAWLAMDRAVLGVERFGLTGPVERWRATRDAIHAEVCQRGYNAAIGSFVQSYDSDRLDASLLMLPLVGFLPPTDVRVQRTVAAIERHLTWKGFVSRYETRHDVDGLPPGEASFLLCTFWLADCQELLGRHDDAVATFERLLAVRNDLGLLSEGYDVEHRRLAGNFPQAFSHVGLINTALNLARRSATTRARATAP